MTDQELERVARETAGQCSVVAYDKYRKSGVDTSTEFKSIILSALKQVQPNREICTHCGTPVSRIKCEQCGYFIYFAALSEDEGK